MIARSSKPLALNVPKADRISPEGPLWTGSYKMLVVLQFTLMAIIAINAVIFTVFVLVRPGRKSPFSAYEDLFSADPLRAASALGFDCGRSFASSSPTMGYCDLRPAAGAFHEIEVTALGEHESDHTFWIKDGKVLLGDLILLWGTPIIRTCDGTAMLSWPARQITASARVPDDRSLDYFLPVRYVVFSSNHVPGWATLWMNDYNHSECPYL